MSQREPKESYVYQPFGVFANVNAQAPLKTFAVVAIERGTSGNIQGLTKKQADRILGILREIAEVV